MSRLPVSYALLLTALSALLFACGGEEPPSEPAAVYTSRAMVRELPKTPQAGAEISLFHEDMPEFRSATGEVVGMESMSMPFPVADAALLDGLAVGDRVRFEFEVRWEGKGHPLLVTDLEKLAEDVRLDFEMPSAETVPEVASESPPAGETPQEEESDTEHQH